MKFAKDSWCSHEYTWAQSGLLTYDKIQHFIGGLVAVLLLFPLVGLWYALAGSMLFWFLWEVKDGFLLWNDRKADGSYRWETVTFGFHYNWGGDGFSWRDMVAAWAGAGMVLIGIWRW
jgi:hypothetical protein